MGLNMVNHCGKKIDILLRAFGSEAIPFLAVEINHLLRFRQGERVEPPHPHLATFCRPIIG